MPLFFHLFSLLMFYTVFREVLPGGHCRVLSKRVPQRLISGILGGCFSVGSLSLWLLPLLPDPFISVAFWPLISPASWPLHLSLLLTPALLPATHESFLVLLCSLLYFTHTHTHTHTEIWEADTTEARSRTSQHWWTGPCNLGRSSSWWNREHRREEENVGINFLL